jgi:uncharacterized membrane protein
MEAHATESPRERTREVDRIAAFSDAVFAIAITLLSLQLAVPAAADLGSALTHLGSGLFAFVISFLVIGAFWVAHHRIFALVVRHDARLMWLNLFLLFFIVLIPFTTTVLAEYGGHRLGVLVYAASVIGAGSADVALVAYALVGRRMCAASVPAAEVRLLIWRGATAPIVFAASMLLLLLPVDPSNVTIAWLAIPIVQRLLERHYRFRLD